MNMNYFDAEKNRDNLVAWLKTWFDENGKDCKAVIGISGGKDSTVVAGLCVRALGKERVVGVLMPMVTRRTFVIRIVFVKHLTLNTSWSTLVLPTTRLPMRLRPHSI